MDCPVGDKHKLEYLLCTPGVCNKEDNPDVPEWCVGGLTLSVCLRIELGVGWCGFDPSSRTANGHRTMPITGARC